VNAVEFQGVSKSYAIYDAPGDRLRELVSPTRVKRHRDFWALHDVRLEVHRGETFCIIGENGSGKSTLLQMVAGILQPSSGTVAVDGRVSALLELGAGFNPEFTGRDNVYLNGSILGLTTRQIDERYQAIEAFAEIGDFINQPVKTYSSGMVVRLAFAVAINVDPEILLVDEALAVGDSAIANASKPGHSSMVERMLRPPTSKTWRGAGLKRPPVVVAAWRKNASLLPHSRISWDIALLVEGRYHDTDKVHHFQLPHTNQLPILPSEDRVGLGDLFRRKVAQLVEQDLRRAVPEPQFGDERHIKAALPRVVQENHVGARPDAGVHPSEFGQHLSSQSAHVPYCRFDLSLFEAPAFQGEKNHSRGSQYGVYAPGIHAPEQWFGGQNSRGVGQPVREQNRRQHGPTGQTDVQAGLVPPFDQEFDGQRRQQHVEPAESEQRPLAPPDQIGDGQPDEQRGEPIETRRMIENVADVPFLKIDGLFP
jgi:ABC-type polysaccharide/polyol phosphate transport system ATPase subunit